MVLSILCVFVLLFQLTPTAMVSQSGLGEDILTKDTDSQQQNSSLYILLSPLKTKLGLFFWRENRYLSAMMYLKVFLFISRKDYASILYIKIIQYLLPLLPHPPIPSFSYLAQSSKLGRSWAHAVSERSKYRNPHHRHPPSGFEGCIPENGVSPAQPGDPETTCHHQQK